MGAEQGEYETEWTHRQGRAKKRVGETTAKTVSILLHPLAMPLYGTAALLYGPSYISILPDKIKWYILAIFALSTLMLPAFAIGLMHSLKIIPDLSLSNRRERIVPLLVVSAGCLFCNFFVRTRLGIDLLSQELIGAMGVILACFTVNLFWKISLHLAAIGGVVGMQLYVTLRGYGDMTSILLIFILLAGLLGTARLYLWHHNVWQVLAGFVVGIGVMLLTVGLL